MNIKSKTKSKVSPPVSKQSTFHRRTTSSLTSLGSPSPFQLKKEVSPLNKDTTKVQSGLFKGRSIPRPNTVIVAKPSDAPSESQSKLTSPTLATNTSRSALTPAKCESSSAAPKLHVPDPMLAARESLQSLRFEARACLDSSKKLIQGLSKCRRTSVASDNIRMMSNSFNNSEIQNDTLKDLVDSIQEIKNRLIMAESIDNYQCTEETMIKAAVGMLERRIEEQEVVLDATSTNVGCSAKCILM